MYGTKRLGEWLVQMGLITPQQLQEALEIQRTTGKRLGETLIELGYLTREDYYKAQAAQYDAPYEPLDDATIEQARAPPPDWRGARLAPLRDPPAQTGQHAGRRDGGP